MFASSEALSGLDDCGIELVGPTISISEQDAQLIDVICAKPDPRLFRSHCHFVNIGDPLDLALSRDQLTPEMFSAGNTFRMLFAKLQRSGTDSTQALNLGDGTGSGFTQVQAEAGATLANNPRPHIG
jgi:hypothetical protein